MDTMGNRHLTGRLMEWFALGVAAGAMIIALVAYLAAHSVVTEIGDYKDVRQRAYSAAPRDHRHFERQPLTAQERERREDAIARANDELNLL